MSDKAFKFIKLLNIISKDLQYIKISFYYIF